LRENGIGRYLYERKLEQIPFGYAFRFMYMQTNYEGEWAPREKVSICEKIV
jgi:hypothetical protein